MDRIQKIIADAGYCSRRKAEELISQGRVKLNGRPIKLGDKASSKDIISIDDQRLYIPKKKNKIDGYTALKRMFDSCYYYQSTYGEINTFQKVIMKICNRYGLFEQKIIDVIKNKRK